MTNINPVQSIVKTRQAPLRKRFLSDPRAAMVTDSAVTSSPDHRDPFHARVSPMPASGHTVAVGVHKSLGGLHDAPTPGDILCASLASCLDSSLRMVANAMSIPLRRLQVEVSGDVDVRGTLMISTKVPVGFQHMTCRVTLEVDDETEQSAIDKLCKLAEHCCVIMQTLQATPKIDTHYHVGGEAAESSIKSEPELLATTAPATFKAQ